jgi:hypothetical protein
VPAAAPKAPEAEAEAPKPKFALSARERGATD